MSANERRSSASQTVGSAAVESTPASVSLSKSTPSIPQASDGRTATAPTSSSHSDAGDAKLASEDGDSSDIQARIEKKRLEHEQQRALQRKAFEQQMALLEKQQREEEQHLLSQRASTAAATPPNEAVAVDPKAAATATAAAKGSADELASAVGNMSIGAKNKSLLVSQAAAHNNDASDSTPVFNEQFLFDDELDNEDSAFVKKYNLNADADQFPVLVDSQSASRGADWPKFGGADAAGANAAADTASSSLRSSATSKSPPPQGTPGMAGGSFGASATRQQAGFPLPSPSPRLSQTGRSSPAINPAFAGVAARQASGPASPSPGLGGLSGDVGRSAGGSRFVNTAVAIPAAAAANLKNQAVGAAAAAAAAAVAAGCGGR